MVQVLVREGGERRGRKRKEEEEEGRGGKRKEGRGRQEGKNEEEGRKEGRKRENKYFKNIDGTTDNLNFDEVFQFQSLGL